ncbi:MAG: hypothetical protein NTY66_02470 [Candidatus Vogelbacteria bacterium]|nr:hypothetical protein [Candidatus Vogelbacteria bacterium]
MPHGYFHFSKRIIAKKNWSLSGLYRIRHHNALAFHTKYLHFLFFNIIEEFGVTYTTLPETLAADILNVWILDSAASSRNRLLIFAYYRT